MGTVPQREDAAVAAGKGVVRAREQADASGQAYELAWRLAWFLAWLHLVPPNGSAKE